MLKFASELLARGISTEDQEMINTAQKILSENSNITKAAPKKPARKSKIQETISEFALSQKEPEIISDPLNVSSIPITRKSNGRAIDINQFKMVEREESKGRNGVPVNKISRSKNIFTDDLTLEMDKVTPKVKLVPREREPSVKINITCTKCNASESVDPVHSRENYVCQDCIIKGKRKR